MTDVAVIGAAPAGLVAALRAAELGARTSLIARDEFGGMAANDGPVPVRTLAHAARLMREARQFGRYGIDVGEPILDYPRLLARVREVANDVRKHSAFREQLERAGATIYRTQGAQASLIHTRSRPSAVSAFMPTKSSSAPGESAEDSRFPGSS